jgi:predicted transposase/invertase (TIGR01784 family)
LKIYRDLKGVIDSAFDEGKLEGKLETAKSAKLMGLKVEDIVKLTGLTKEEIERL